MARIKANRSGPIPLTDYMGLKALAAVEDSAAPGQCLVGRAGREWRIPIVMGTVRCLIFRQMPIPRPAMLSTARLRSQDALLRAGQLLEALARLLHYWRPVQH